MDTAMTWLAAVPTLIGFGLALGLNPALYGATADTLARNQNIKIRLFWLLAGLVAGATVLVLVLHSFNPTNFVTAARGHVDAAVLNRTVDLVAGVILLAGAATMAVWASRVREPPRRKKKREPKQNARPFSLFALGFGSAIIGFTTLPIMYLTGRLIVSLSSDPIIWLAAYAVFLAALVAPFVSLAWTWSRFPATTQNLTALYQRLLQWDFRWVAAAVMALGGLVLLGLAVFVHR